MNKEQLYQAIGQKIRTARETSRERYSQERLAKHLGLSRASIVNIESGRQHAPLHLLWEIAETLGTELGQLIPTKQELATIERPVRLTSEMISQIENVLEGNPEAQNQLTEVISQLKISIEPEETSKENL